MSTPNPAVECRVTLLHSDFIMRNHRVHGVSVMPGVTFLDLFLRVLRAEGHDPASVVFSRVLFSEPVITSEGHDREIRVSIDSSPDGTYRITADSCWSVSGTLYGPWHENARAELGFTDRPAPGALDVEAFKGSARYSGSMDDLYRRARGEEIRHGAAMRCTGPRYERDGAALVELSPGSSGVTDGGGFLLHPAVMDASTIAGFGQTDVSGQDPFVPVFLERFRATAFPQDPVLVYAPTPETLSGSGEVLRNSYTLHDVSGNPAAEFEGLVCKRIRDPEQLTRLLPEANPVSPEVASGNTAGGPSEVGTSRNAGAAEETITTRLVRLLREFVAGALGGADPDTVPTDSGFYDLGLESTDLLRISERLEDVVGTSLYPTLLFEYGDIDSLVEHLIGTHSLDSAGIPESVGSRDQGERLPDGEKPTETPEHESAVEFPAGPSPDGPSPDGPPLDGTASAAAAPDDVAVSYRETWVTAAAPVRDTERTAVVLGTTPELESELSDGTARGGARIVCVSANGGSTGADHAVDPESESDIVRLLEQLRERFGRVPEDWILLAGSLGYGPGGITDETSSFRAFRNLAVTLSHRADGTPIRLLFAHAASAGVPLPGEAALSAFAATVAAESSRLSCRTVDLGERPDPATIAGPLLNELAATDSESVSRYREGRRQVRRWVRAAEPPDGDVPWRAGGRYLITGGSGGIATLLTTELVREHRARVVLVGRGECPPETADLMRRSRELGSEVHWVRADVSSSDGARRAVTAARELLGGIDGLLHCAGAVRDALFFRASGQDAAEVLAPKVAGTRNLDEATAEEPLDFFVLFSSTTAALPNPGQSAYAYANAYQCHFAASRAGRRDRPGRSLAVGWPHWAEGGMRMPEDGLRRSRERDGLSPMPTRVGMDSLRNALRTEHSRLLVLYGDPGRLDAVLDAGSEPRVEAEAVVSGSRVGSETDSDSPRAAAAAPRADETSALRDSVTPDSDGIAVIGIAGRYPGADGLGDFWRDLTEGRDRVTGIPEERWDHSAYFDAEKGRPGRTYGRWGGFLTGAADFDHGFFGISRRDAERMDPQERLFLTTAWQTLEDAGHSPAALGGRAVGVFAGVMWNHYQLETDADGVAPTAMHAAVANRVSHTLDLRGPSMTVDTACSSSLTAIHLALESLRRGESESALAGGVNVTAHPQKYLQLSQGRFLSTDGRCRSFGAGGDGYVPGEGVGAVLLKPLARARADGDHVYGVIRGSVLNHTGRTSGFTVPNPSAQAELVEEALRRSGWDPATVGVIEAHGTGTELGDPIEVDALRRAFAARESAGRRDCDRSTGCALGSVKSNIGHLESAAGIAGLTKVLLQLRHRTLVPSLHAAEVNPRVELDDSPFRLQQRCEPWRERPDGVPRRAGISAFGAGGSNAHLLVEEAPAPAERARETGEQLFVLSARDETGLRDRASSLLAELDGWSSRSRQRAGSPVAEITESVAALLGVAPEALDVTEPLGDLGFDGQALRELGSGLPADPRDGSTPRIAADDSIADLGNRCHGFSEREQWSSGPNRADDLAWTLQTGRNPMRVRLAVVTDGVERLSELLRSFLAGEAPPEGCHWPPHSTADEIVTTGDAESAVGRGDWREVARHWMTGDPVPWEHSPISERARRVPLPGYPFRGETCWIGRWRTDGANGSEDASEAVTEEVTDANTDSRRGDDAAGVSASTTESDGSTESTGQRDEVELRLLDSGIALITMRESSGANMFTPTVMRGLTAAFDRVAEDRRIRVVVLTGTETVFSMGATSEGLRSLAEGSTSFTDTPFVYEGLLRCEVPVVAAVRGHASGGGLVFGLYADSVVLSRDGVYSANFMNHGFTPGMGATHVLPRRMGEGLSREMLLTGRSYGGEQLERRGADVMFADSAEVLGTALEIARSIADKPADALRIFKRDAAERVLGQLSDVVDREARMHRAVLGPEARERVERHFAKVERFRGSGGADETSTPAVETSVSEVKAPVPPGEVVTTPAPGAAPDPPAGSNGGTVGLSDTTGFAETAEPAGPTDEEITSVVEKALREQLYLRPDEIDPELSFSEMGLDSIGAVEIVRRLNDAFGVNMDSVAVYDQPTIPRLVRFVRHEHSRGRELRRSVETDTGHTSEELVPQERVEEPTAGEDVPVSGQQHGVRESVVPALGTVSLSGLDAFAGRSGAAGDEVPSLPTHRTVEGSPEEGRRAEHAATVSSREAGSEAPHGPEGEARPRDPASHYSGERPIAVIGMAGRFPDAPDLESFWRNLAEGHDSIREVPASRWNVDEVFDPNNTRGHTYSRWAALISDVDKFDAELFRVSPLEAESIDPQQRLFLETAWHCLEDAGYAVRRGDHEERPRCGVFVGCGSGDYTELLRERGRDTEAHAFLGNSSAVLAARIAYQLDFAGPTVSVDTACSSSLVAVHQAAESIARGECTTALAGGVAVMNTPRMHVMTSRAGMLSPTGDSSPFDAAADGIVLGEGVGAVLLKPLDEALADGDNVHGMLLAGGINGDGHTNGITAPNATAQVELMRRVWDRAGVGADDIGYVETHGTGTQLGDPIEVSALQSLFAARDTANDPCLISSVKAAVGHTTMAAGITGLLTMLLALRHGAVPPTAGYDTPNPAIDFTRAPLRVAEHRAEWPVNPTTRRRIGAVSSFGFSGTNAHLVVAQPPARPDNGEPREMLGELPVPISARTPQALRDELGRLAGHLACDRDEPAETGTRLLDIAHTLATGRAHYRCRAVVLAHDVERLGELLREAAATAVPANGTHPEPFGYSSEPEALRKAREFLAGEEPDWNELWRNASPVRVSLPSRNLLRERHWVEVDDTGGGTPPAPDRETEDASPGVHHFSGSEPVVRDHRVAGRALLPGAWSLSRAARAILLEHLPAPFALHGVCWLRPVEAGDGGSLRLDVQRRTESSLRFEFLPDNGAGCHARGGARPVDPASTDEARRRVETDPDDFPNIWSRQRIYEVFASAGIDYGPAFRVLRRVGFGPDTALGVLDDETDGRASDTDDVLSPFLLDGAMQVVAVLAASAESHSSPALPFAVERMEVYEPQARPRYAHAVRERSDSYTVSVVDEAGWECVRFNGLVLRAPTVPESGARQPSARGTSVDPMVHVPVLREIPRAAIATARREPEKLVLVHTAARAEEAARLRRLHERRGDTVDSVTFAEAESAVSSHPDTVCVLVGGDEIRNGAVGAGLAVLRLVKALLAAGLGQRPLVVKAVLDTAVSGEHDSAPHPDAAVVLGLLRSVAAEHPDWRVGCVDVRGADSDSQELVPSEDCAERFVLLRDGKRFVRELEPARFGDSDESPFRPGGVYVLLGGAGGIGVELSRHLARTVAANLVWIGRRPLDDEVRAAMDSVRALGGEVHYFRGDAADPASLRACVDRVRETLGGVDGAFHAAMVLRDRTLERLSESDFTEVVAPKDIGAVNFAEALRDETPDFVVYFSSAASFTDAAGQGNYAAASTCEDAWAARLRATGLPVTVVNWGFWGSVGAVAQQRYLRRFAELDVESIEPAEGFAALTRILAARVPQALVVRAGSAGRRALGIRDPGSEPGEQRPSDAGAGATSGEGFHALDALAAAELRDALLPLLGPLPASRSELADRLGVVESRLPLFRALLRILTSTGELDSSEGRIHTGERSVPPESPASFAARYPELAPHLELTGRCVGALPEVLRGELSGTEVLFPKGSMRLVSSIYRDGTGAEYFHDELARRAVRSVESVHRERKRRARLLEIGAGTGTCTAFVLRELDETGFEVDYTYTDVSSAFLRHGEREFADRDPEVEFRTLDIERDPSEQGFETSYYDVVIATNVLHATASLHETLHNVRSLLRPGGTLLVNEVTRAHHFLTLTFGLTTGWWRFTDPESRLPDSPLLSPRSWRQELQNHAFDEVEITTVPGTRPAESEQCVFAAVRGEFAEPGEEPGEEPGASEMIDRVKRAFADVLKYREADLDPDLTFENFGVDSLVSQEIVRRLESDLGELPATLLFEHPTIRQLAERLHTEPGSRPTGTRRHGSDSGAGPVSEHVAEPPTERGEERPEGRAGSEGAHSVAVTGESTADEHTGASEVGSPDTDIAVVAMAGRYPGAPDLATFWDNLRRGVSSVTEVPPERWDWLEHADPPRTGEDGGYARWGGFIDGVAEFDPGFFGILPSEAADTDPQERLFLEKAWEVLEEAGHVGPTTREPNTGVFAGTMYASYGQLAARARQDGIPTAAHSAAWSIANRASYVLDLRGPSFAVDSACSSSLLAVHLACESLRRGECRMAIAGGVNVILHPDHLNALGARNMLSPNGRCRVFDEAADGFVPGEGVGAVLLKPLRDAVDDGNRILGVIKSGAANAGGKTSGYTVPNPDAQADLVTDALLRSGVEPASLGYVEAHGTGTELGDPIECAALTRALRRAGDGTTDCAVGSVKANIGHLEGAAGIAGLTKVLLQLAHSRIAPSPNLEHINPKIDLSESPLRPVAGGQAPYWAGPPSAAGDTGVPRDRVAGVSSFGAGGANVHLVVTEHGERAGGVRAEPSRNRRTEVFVLSAPTDGQLTELAGAVALSLRDPDESHDLAALAWTSQFGRRAFPHRLAFVTDSVPELAEALLRFSERGETGTDHDRVRVFHGTGSATPGSVPESEDPAALASSWSRGAEVDWERLWRGLRPGRAAFPTTPYRRRRYWLAEPGGPRSGAVGESGSGAARPGRPDAAREDVPVEAGGGEDLDWDAGETDPVSAADIGCEYRTAAWRSRPFPDTGAPLPENLLLVVEEPDLARPVMEAAAVRGVRCRVAVARGFSEADLTVAETDVHVFDPTDPERHARLVGELGTTGVLPDAVLHLLPEETAGDPAGGARSVFALAARLLERAGGSPLHYVAACSGGGAGSAAVAGVLRTLGLEHGSFSGGEVAMEGASPGNEWWADPLLRELSLRGTVRRVRYRDGERFENESADFVPPAPVESVHGVWLVTGGAGQVGRHTAHRLVRDGARAVVLLGRSESSEHTASVLTELTAAGAEAEYLCVDVTDAARVRWAVAEVNRRFGALTGVVHAAGVVEDRRAVHKTVEEFDAVLAPKVSGTLNLDEALLRQPLEWFVLFSSLAAVGGNPGQADYAAANAFLDTYAEFRPTGRPGKAVSIGWPLWEDGGMTVDDANRALFARVWRMAPLSTSAAMCAFERALSPNAPAAFAVVSRDHAEPETDSTPDTASGIRREVPPVETVEKLLRGLAAGYLLVDESEVDPEANLLDTGFDSITLTELINEVNREYGTDLLPTVLFECVDLASFARYLVEWHGTELAAATGSAEVVEPLPRSSVADHSATTRESVADSTHGDPGWLLPPESNGPVGNGPVGNSAVENGALPAEAESERAVPGETQRGGPVENGAVGNGPVRNGAVRRGTVLEGDQPDEIAVIGIGGTFPGAADPAEFWRRLTSGDDLVRAVPEDRHELLAHSATRGVRGGFLDDAWSFDAELFGISPREAALMDPQQRVFLQTVRRTLEDAGYRTDRIAGTETGLYVGVSTNDWADVLTSREVGVEAHTATGVAHSVLANRVSYLFDLRGPSEAVDTACSSSLVAVHHAVRALREGECVTALAGGVNLMLSPNLFTAFDKSGMLSPGHTCRTFDSAADGYVRGEGAGAVLLKPLENALADGDHVYAVIRGSAVNHVGRASSLTAPQPEAQTRVILRAHRRAGFSPDTVSAVEAHGTATRLGDPVEAEGLKRAFERLYQDWGLDAPSAPHIALASVKSSIGHLEAASGIAGMIKMLLAMHHRQLPPTLHYREPNPLLRLEGSPFEVNDRLRDWSDDSGPLRAGVSSFGFGGANAHVVLESHEQSQEVVVR